MNISLNDFEKHIEDKILKRGWSYFKNGTVEDLKVCKNRYFQAYVFGTQPYEVEIQIIHGQIQSHKCDCPYDWGEFCKYEVAVFHAIRAWLDGDLLVENKHKSKTTTQLLQETLDQVEIKELKRFVFSQARRRYSFRYDFLEHFEKAERPYWEDEDEYH